MFRKKVLSPSSGFRCILWVKARWNGNTSVIEIKKRFSETSYARLNGVTTQRTTIRITAKTRLKIPWPESASELYRPSDRRLSAKLVPTFADRGCHVVSVTNPYGLNNCCEEETHIYIARHLNPIPGISSVTRTKRNLSVWVSVHVWMSGPCLIVICMFHKQRER
jgi:hypothetical protein